MEIPEDVFQAALAANNEGEPPTPEEPEVPVEPDGAAADGDGAEGGAEPDSGAETPNDAPAEPTAPTPTPETPKNYTLDDVKAVLSILTPEQLARIAGVTPAAAAVTPVVERIPAHIKAMLDSTDEGQKRFGESLLEDHRATQQRISMLESQLEQRAQGEAVQKVESEINAVKGDFVIRSEVDRDGKRVVVEQPVTDAVMDQVADFYERNPQAAGVLTIEEVTRRLYPTLSKRSATPTPGTAGGAPKQDATARRVVKVGTPSGQGSVQANGAAAGRVPARPAPAPPNETMKQAIDRGFSALGIPSD